MEGIVTPEAVVLDVETAGVASRVFAGLIDFIVQIGLMFAGTILLALMGVIAGASSFNMATALLLAFVIMVYPLLAETQMRARTIGQRS